MANSHRNRQIIRIERPGLDNDRDNFRLMGHVCPLSYSLRYQNHGFSFRAGFILKVTIGDAQQTAVRKPPRGRA